MEKGFKPIKFPQDELAHDQIVEWWYFNGHLKDSSGNKYAFMNCLFKTDVIKVKIPFLSRVPLKTLYFSHAFLSDIRNKKFYPMINPVVMISNDSFSKPLFFVNYTNPIVIKGYLNSAIEKTKKFEYRIKTENMDLKLSSVKKPILEGGNGYLDLNSKKTYYYSLTNFKTEGVIKIKDKPIKVVGKSWMDHQWTNIRHLNKWTWFSIQLNSQAEMLCFEYDDGETKTYLASISYPDNTHEHIQKVKLTPLGIKWTSPKTKTEYPLSWRIEIPSKGIDLEVKPSIKNQEMIFGTINYWEGPLTVKGLFNNKKAEGLGFLELVGYPSKWGYLEFAKNELGNTINKTLSYAQNGVLSIAKDIIIG